MSNCRVNRPILRILDKMGEREQDWGKYYRSAVQMRGGSWGCVYSKLGLMAPLNWHKLCKASPVQGSLYKGP